MPFMFEGVWIINKCGLIEMMYTIHKYGKIELIKKVQA